jgi:hypothetical protein
LRGSEGDAILRSTGMNVPNAGLALIHVYLPPLFRRLNLLTDQETFTSAAATTRAVQLLQHLAYGDDTPPDAVLALNGVLCGLSVDAPIGNATLSDEERQMCDDALHALIRQWSVLPTMSLAAFRIEFLQRQGRLTRTDGDWQLIVSRGQLDAYVDQLPWPISPIRHPWMPWSLRVQW